VFGRFTQRFNNAKPEDGKKGGISNAYYSIQADYERYTRIRQDARHGDNLFRYGYVGKFETLKEKTYAFGIDETTGLPGFLQGPDNDTMVVFTSSDINPQLSAYTQQYYNLYPNAQGRYENLTQINQDRGALRNGDLPLNQRCLIFNDLHFTNLNTCGKLKIHESNLSSSDCDSRLFLSAIADN